MRWQVIALSQETWLKIDNLIYGILDNKYVSELRELYEGLWYDQAVIMI